VTVTTDTHGSLELAADISAQVYRIVPEALANAARHRRATAVVVKLVSGGGLLRVSIEDTGMGLPPESARGPFAGHPYDALPDGLDRRRPSVDRVGCRRHAGAMGLSVRRPQVIARISRGGLNALGTPAHPTDR
jgi:hypothetical protein